MKASRALPLLMACAAALAALPARADDDASGVLDTGRFVVFSRGEPVATEDFEFQRGHDSLYVTARADRRARAADGSVKPYMKSMELILNADDGGILAYVSTEKFDGHATNRTIYPGDTVLTVAIQKDDHGDADKIVRLPGRIYVMDAGLFTLFDVIGRSLHGRIFGQRPVALVTLGDRNAMVNATAAPAGRDTLRWGARPVLADAISLTDSTSAFVLYTSPEGRMLRLENAAADLVVMREPPAAPPARRRHAPRPSRPR